MAIANIATLAAASGALGEFGIGLHLIVEAGLTANIVVGKVRKIRSSGER